MRKGNPAQTPPGFTLVELIIVMTLLALITGLVLPSLSRSIRARNLKDEAVRFVAATEYGRDEAVSQGVPMTVWVDPATQRFGVSAKAGYDGVEARNREFTLNPDIHFEVTGATAGGGMVDVVEFAPDGAPGTAALETVQMADRFDSTVTIARTNDGWGYEVVKEGK